MDEPRTPQDTIALAGRCLGLMFRYAMLWTRYAMLVVLDRLLRLPRP